MLIQIITFKVNTFGVYELTVWMCLLYVKQQGLLETGVHQEQDSIIMKIVICSYFDHSMFDQERRYFNDKIPITHRNVRFRIYRN